jgi:flavin-dependent dehydrogenase
MIKTTVVIAGGGPAGAATSISLSRRGIPNIIVEAETGPQQRPGETIPPNAKPLFARLGIDALLDDKRHMHCYGNRYAWGSNVFADKDFVTGIHGNGVHIDRLHFEQQLTAVAADSGATMLWGTRLKAATYTDGGWLVDIEDGTNGIQQVACTFLVDATGRACRVARMIGIKRIAKDKLAGIAACFSNVSGMPLYTFIEATETGWWYAVPLSGNRLAAAYMTDSDLIDAALLKSSGYLAVINNTQLMSPIFNGPATESVSISVKQASTSYLARRYGPGWLAVGDAAFAYDPISSYGITSALEGGFYAGNAIADELGGFKEALPAYDWLISKAFSIYLDMYVNQYAKERRWMQSDFWMRRHNFATIQ